jgi:recombination endonuclease VII
MYTSEELRAWREIRKKTGVCQACDKKVHNENGTLCLDHLASHLIRSQVARKLRLSKGLCGCSGCKNIPIKGKSLCSTHLKRANEESTKKYLKRKELKVCVTCSAPPLLNYIYCANHHSSTKNFSENDKKLVTNDLLKPNIECGMCHKTLLKDVCIDHRHADNRYRGLLCANCNFVLGHAKDQIKILEAGITYLRGQNEN